MADQVETTTPTVEETAPVEAVATENKEAEPATNGKEANGDATNGDATNGDSTVHTTETNGDHVKEANGHGKEETNGNGVESNGNGVESNGHSKEDTNGVAEKEATKRPAEAGDEEATEEKIAKLKEVAAEKVAEVTTTETAEEATA